MVTATPPSDARADIVHEIEILLFDEEGSFVDNGTARFVLDEVIGALIEPDSLEIEVPSEGTQTASFIVRNMGNCSNHLIFQQVILLEELTLQSERQAL